MLVIFGKQGFKNMIEDSPAQIKNKQVLVYEKKQIWNCLPRGLQQIRSLIKSSTYWEQTEKNYGFFKRKKYN